jgi:general secretion pathway protein I
VRGARRGFTLIEVLVAIAILGLALTAIFASEAGAVKAGHRARRITVATILARCKMGEIEEEIAREGFPAIEMHGTDSCCEGGEIDDDGDGESDFVCDWSVDRIEFPDLEGEEDGLLPEAEAEGEDADTGFSQAASVEDILGGTAPTSGGDMVGELALSYAWPILQPALEEQVRRARVTVRWREGLTPPTGSGQCERDPDNPARNELRCMDVVQYLVAEPPNVVEEDT